MTDLSNYECWLKDKQDMGWELPPAAPWYLRLPVVRHIRAIRLAFAVARHQALWSSLGMFNTGYDNWILYAIWRGWC